MMETAPLILCIDDDAHLRADIVDELQRSGYRVLAAESAEAAFELLENGRPDLILCDISMPDQDGYAVLDRVRAERPEIADVPFVFLTALANRDSIILGKSLGADDYLTKPVDYDMLLATVAARLAQVNRIRKGYVAEIDSLRQSLANEELERSRDSLLLSVEALDRMAIGFFLVGPDGHIRETNAVARAMLDEADGLKAIKGRLVAAHTNSASAMRQALTDVGSARAANATLVLERDFRRAVLVRLHAAPLSLAGNDLGIVVTAVDPERMPALSPEIARKLYGLTPTEARLAIAVAEGKRPDEITSAFAIAQSTINFHLNNVFRKTGTSRQADMVALLVRTAVADQPPPQ